MGSSASASQSNSFVAQVFISIYEVFIHIHAILLATYADLLHIVI